MIIEPEIYMCPKCSSDICCFSILSCNTVDAEYWTDGKIVGPMYDEHQWLVKCSCCGALVWRDKLELLDKNYDESDCSTPELKKKDYLLKLKETVLTKEEEKYLRIKVWQIGNDKRREKKEQKEFSKKDIKNLQTLYLLLDISDENERIMMSEIKRELGDFEGAENILKNPFSEEFSTVVSRLRELIKNRDHFVAKIYKDETYITVHI